MKYIVLILATLVLNTATAEIIKHGIAESAYEDCKMHGETADAIQMIRQEGAELGEIILNLAQMLQDEAPEGYKLQPIYLAQVREVGRWVYKYYPVDWEPVMVGTTYTHECMEKTFARLKRIWPDVAGHQK